jgi:hypothetical protein
MTRLSRIRNRPFARDSSYLPNPLFVEGWPANPRKIASFQVLQPFLKDTLGTFAEKECLKEGTRRRTMRRETLNAVLEYVVFLMLCLLMIVHAGNQ